MVGTSCRDATSQTILLPNDFAFLSHDIVYDILELGHFEMIRDSIYSWSEQYCCLGGRWGEIAGSFEIVRFENEKIQRRFYNSDTTKLCSEECSLKDAKDLPVNSTKIGRYTDLKTIMHLVPNFYEKLVLHIYWSYIPGQYTDDTIQIPRRFFERLGTKFTKIIWKIEKKDGDGSAVPGEVEFFERQLKSPVLRDLQCTSPFCKGEGEDMTELLIGFVSKPHFERLHLPNTMLPGKVFLAAYKSWTKRREHELFRSAITAQISGYERTEFTNQIINFSWIIQGNYRFFIRKHPSADNYDIKMFYEDEPGQLEPSVLNMTISARDC